MHQYYIKLTLNLYANIYFVYVSLKISYSKIIIGICQSSLDGR